MAVGADLTERRAERPLLAAGEAILAPLLPTEQGIRLLGVTLSKFEGEEEETDIVAAPADLLSLI